MHAAIFSVPLFLKVFDVKRVVVLNKFVTDLFLETIFLQLLLLKQFCI